jgi:hypothetical protein
MQDVETLNPLLTKLAHLIAVPVASVGAVAPHIQEQVSLAREIMSAPASTYASVLSAIYLTLMIIKTVWELYQSFKNVKKSTAGEP